MLTAEWTELDPRFAGPQPRLTPEQNARQQERIAAVAAQREQERVAILERTLAELAESDEHEANLVGIDREIADEQQVADIAVAEHRETTAPIQRELESIRQRKVAARLAKETPDPILAAQEHAEQDKLRAANELLDAKCQASRRRLETLRAERLAIAKKVTRPLLTASLYIYARPDLLAAYNNARTARLWAAARVKDAEQKLARLSHDPLRRAELEAANVELTRAVGIEAETHRRLLE